MDLSWPRHRESARACLVDLGVRAPPAMVRRECEELLAAIGVPMEWEEMEREETEGEAPSAVEIGPVSLGSPLPRIHVLKSLALMRTIARASQARHPLFFRSGRRPARHTRGIRSRTGSR